MTSDNHSCCATDPAANPAECGAPHIDGHIAELVEFGGSLTATSAGRPPRHQITWGFFIRVAISGLAIGMILPYIPHLYSSGSILGGVQTGSCCAPTRGDAPSTSQAAIGADPCCALPAGAASLQATPSQALQQPSAPATDPGEAGRPAAAGAIDPTRNVVFKVQGLECPAVRGLGCGHLLAPELAALDKLDGVERSFANRTGTMIRVAVAAAADRNTVAEAVLKALTDEDRKAVRLAGDELKRALDREEWRGAGRIGELSAIEFHTLALHRFKTFAKAEKLDKETTDKLVEIAEQQWKRLCEEARADGETRPDDWGKRIKASLPIFLERAKGILTAEQLERLKTTLTTPCRGDDRPEAPPASSPGLTCSLTPDQLAAQRKPLLPGLFQRAERVGDIPDGLSFRFAHRPGLVAELAAIIEKQRACCTFLTFRLIAEKDEGPITLEVSGPPGSAEMLGKLQTAGGADGNSQERSCKDNNTITKNMNPNLVSLFRVPSLVCSAAPEIGCGPCAKPILLDLQRDSNISEAWLNRAGTVLAVVGTDGSTRESRAKAVRTALEAREKATATELDGDAREQQLKSFSSGEGWFRGAQVDVLSKQEAGIIAARLVRRIQARVSLPDDKAKALQLGFVDAFDRFIASKPDPPQEDRLQRYNQELLKVAQANLDEKGVAAFKEALAQGIWPVANEE